MSIDQAAADTLLSTTRAVRRRLDVTRPVPREVIVDCVRLAQQAPTGGNTQNWRWVIVDEPARRNQLAALCSDAAQNMQQAADAAITRGDTHTQRIYNDARDLALRLNEMPVLVLPCLAGAPTPGAEQPFYASIYPAVWSFQLALRARGLGTVLTTFHLRHAADIVRLLGMPDNTTPCALMPVAYTIGDSFSPAKRPEPETIIHWNGW